MKNARFEIVQTDAGWHARHRARNSETVWTTEVHTRRATSLEAIVGLSRMFSPVNRATAGEFPGAELGEGIAIYVHLDEDPMGAKMVVPVVDVDDRLSSSGV